MRGLGGRVVKVVRLLLITWSVNTEIAGSILTAGRVYSTPVLIDKDCQFSYRSSGVFSGYSGFLPQ